MPSGDSESTEDIPENSNVSENLSRAQSISSLESINSSANVSQEQHFEQVQAIGQNANVKDLEAALQEAQTNTSTRTKVPMSERRGILAQITLIPEYDDPRDYPNSVKNLIVLIVAFAAVCGPMGNATILPAIDDVSQELNTSVSIVNVSVGMYMLSLGILPLWWSSFSERFGRRNVYLISFTMFVGFSIGCALSPNISSLIIFRVLAGGSSASVQAVGAGTIGDLYVPHERGTAMGWYYLGPLMGPLLAPIIGGAVAQAWGWRATQWVLVIASGLADMMVLLLLPETLRKQDNLANIRQLLAQAIDEKLDNGEKLDNELSREASQDLVRRIATRESEREHEADEEAVGDSIMPSLSRLTTNRSNYSKNVAMKRLESQLSKSLTERSQPKKSRFQLFQHEAYEIFIRPMHSVILLGYPPVGLVITASSVSFGLVYFFNLTISYEYARPPYSFSYVILGLMFIPNSVTYVIASLIGGRWVDLLLRRYADKHNGELRPEARISWNTVLANILFPPACLIFGWTLNYGEHWVVPLIGTAIFGFACMLMIGVTVTYLVDTLPGKGATGIALNNLIRQILAAVATFIVEPLIRALGVGVLYSILTGIIIASSGLLIILKKKGDYFREHYDLSTYYERL